MSFGRTSVEDGRAWRAVVQVCHNAPARPGWRRSFETRAAEASHATDSDPPGSRNGRGRRRSGAGHSATAEERALANLTWLEAAPARRRRPSSSSRSRPGAASMVRTCRSEPMRRWPSISPDGLPTRVRSSWRRRWPCTTRPACPNTPARQPSLNTARDVVADLVRSLARFGPKRFYIVASGEAAGAALDPASALLAPEGILCATRISAKVADRVSRGIRQQPKSGTPTRSKPRCCSMRRPISSRCRRPCGILPRRRSDG